MKIKAKNPKNSSMQLIVPVDGLITIDTNGVAEVSAKCAAVLVTSTNDWEYAKKAADDSDEEEDDVDEDASDRDKFAAHLDTLTLAQMKDLAKEGEMPEEAYNKLSSKKLMKAYLLKKYDEAAEAGDSDEEEDDEEK